MPHKPTNTYKYYQKNNQREASGSKKEPKIGNNDFKGTTLILGTVAERNGGFSCNINFYLYYFLHLRLAVAALREQKKSAIFFCCCTQNSRENAVVRK